MPMHAFKNNSAALAAADLSATALAPKALDSSSQKMLDIIGVIDRIAFQTNILAPNTAVEPDRVCEQGRGFVAVAAEMRNLAQRSAAAVKKSKTLISDSVDKVEERSKLVAERATRWTR